MNDVLKGFSVSELQRKKSVVEGEVERRLSVLPIKHGHMERAAALAPMKDQLLLLENIQAELLSRPPEKVEEVKRRGRPRKNQ